MTFIWYLFIGWILNALFGFGHLFVDALNQIFNTSFTGVSIYYLIIFLIGILIDIRLIKN